MFISYEDSVYAATDQEGCLAGPDVRRLLADHELTLQDLLEDYPDEDAQALFLRGDAAALLGALGY